MKKFKLTLGLLVVIFVALLIYQNRAYFFAKTALSFILVPDKFQWTAPAVENLAYFGGCLVIGILIAGYLGLVSKFRSSKKIKQLNNTILSQAETINALQSDLDTFKQDSYVENSSDKGGEAGTTDLIKSSDQQENTPITAQASIEDTNDPSLSKKSGGQPINIAKA